MLDVHKYHEISESTHRIMNPLAPERLMLVGEICRLDSASRVLDLASGKGELLCRFAERFGASGTGVDVYPPLAAVAAARAAELGVESHVSFVVGDASEPLQARDYDLVSCLGATWIGGDLAGTLQIMKRYVKADGWVVVGEVFWARPPSAGLATRYGQTFADLAGTLAIFVAAKVDLVEMVLTNDDDWDRYAASQWLNVADWLAANPGHVDTAAVLTQRDESRRQYLSEERGTLGWGVFVGRVASS